MVSIIRRKCYINNEVKALRVVQDALAGGDVLIVQHLAHHVREGDGQTVRLGMAQADGEAALRITIDDQHFLSCLKESAIQRLQDTVYDTDGLIAKAKRYTDITELTPELLRLFIRKIVVHEHEVVEECRANH